MRIDRTRFIMKCAEKAMNPSEVANVAGLCVETIYKITSGEGKVTIKTLGKISRALGCHPSELLAERM